MKKIIFIIATLFAFALIFIIAGYLGYYDKQVPLINADITVKVVYAYIGHQTLNSGETGLNYDSTDRISGYNLAPYIIVLGITNQATAMVSLTNFRIYVAPEIVYNSVGFNQSNGQPAPGGLGSPSIEVHNAVISDARTGQSIGGFSNYLDAGKSRLIALTGVISLDKSSEEELKNGALYIYGAATAQTGYADWQTVIAAQGQTAYDLERITFTNVNGDYLFNNLLNKNEVLLIDGLSAKVQSDP